jgi:hypothetical protein
MDAPCDLAISASVEAIESSRLGWREWDRTPMTPERRPGSGRLPGELPEAAALGKLPPAL